MESPQLAIKINEMMRQGGYLPPLPPPVFTQIKKIKRVNLPPVPFDRKIRDQVVVADLVTALVYGMEQTVLPPKDRTLLSGIFSRSKKIKAVLYHGADRLILHTDGYKKYMRVLTRIRAEVGERYGEYVPRDFYCAVMMMVFDVAVALEGHKNSDYVDHWHRMAEMMETLYLHMDGGTVSEYFIVEGQAVKARLENIMKGI